MNLNNKVVLITGGSEGIGAACVEAFARRGSRIALTARNEGKLQQAAGERHFWIAGDLMDSEVRKRVVRETVRHFGTVDVLVNNAGIGLYSPASSAAMNEVRALFELNYFAAVEMAQLVAPILVAQRRGTIVNVSSIAGLITLPWFPHYSASKAALIALTDGLRMELRRDGVHAMAVCPGYVKTDFQQHVLGGAPPARLRRGRPLGISAEGCARAIVRGVENDARTVITPGSGQFLVAAARSVPAFVEWQMERIYRKA